MSLATSITSPRWSTVLTLETCMGTPARCSMSLAVSWYPMYDLRLPLSWAVLTRWANVSRDVCSHWYVPCCGIMAEFSRCTVISFSLSPRRGCCMKNCVSSLMIIVFLFFQHVKRPPCVSARGVEFESSLAECVTHGPIHAALLGGVVFINLLQGFEASVVFVAPFGSVLRTCQHVGCDSVRFFTAVAVDADFEGFPYANDVACPTYWYGVSTRHCFPPSGGTRVSIPCAGRPFRT